MRSHGSSRGAAARAVLGGFAAVALLGAGLLMLPVSSAGASTSFMQALFTAVSALCVTGLTVVDTATHWSGFGHAVILVLVQIGGIGVMTFASMIGITVLRKLSLRSKAIAATETKAAGLAELRRVIMGVVRISLLVEAAVGIVLAFRFAIGYGAPPAEAAWRGIFHAVTAFNNAGFALFTDGLSSLVGDPWISVPICAATIIGGLGFPVIMQLWRLPGRPRQWSMNTRIVLVGSLVLLSASAVFITAIEWSNPRTLGAVDTPTKLLVGFTQAVQTRTSGFTVLDVEHMHPLTWFGTDVLMFIGGGPAGTAGGIKITTFAVLLAVIVAEIRGDVAVNIFGKRLPRSVHREAITVALSAVALVTAGTMTLLILSPFSLDRTLFEAVSAFSTTGLSTGITGQLPTAGQWVLILLMFTGRLGPILFATSLALRERTLLYELPKERPIIG